MVRHRFHSFSINDMLWTYCSLSLSLSLSPLSLSLSSSSPSFIFLPFACFDGFPLMPFPLRPMSEDVFSSKTLHRMQKKTCKEFVRRAFGLCPGGGGGALPLLTVVETCRWTGYDFPVITIDTGYLNRPNWLLAGYSVYHRVASQPTLFMTGPRSRHQRRYVRDATDFMNV